MSAAQVAVVVVTFNRADLLERMLAGLGGLDRAPDAVFVVNNASTDHTREVLERSTLPGWWRSTRRRTSAVPVASTSG